MELIEKLRLTILRAKIDQRLITLSPRFSSTLLFLYLLAVLGLVYGHVLFVNPKSYPTSILISLIAWVGGVIIIALKDPLLRLKQLFKQMATILALWVLLGNWAVIVLIFLQNNKASGLMLVIWAISSIYVGWLVWKGIKINFWQYYQSQSENYAGMRSTPILFLLMIINITWWIGFKFFLQ